MLALLICSLSIGCEKSPNIFGPIEGIWDRLEMGSKVEVWGIESDDDHIELDFIDDSDSVGGTGFYARNAVY